MSLVKFILLNNLIFAIKQSLKFNILKLMSTIENSAINNSSVYAFSELSINSSKSMHLFFKFSDDTSDDAKKNENDLMNLILANLEKGFEVYEVPQNFQVFNNLEKLEELKEKSKEWKKITVSNEFINKYYNQNENHINDYVIKNYITTQFNLF